MEVKGLGICPQVEFYKNEKCPEGHFFIFEGKMYIFPLLAKVTGFENEILGSENPSIKLNVSNAIKGRGGGRQGFDIFP